MGLTAESLEKANAALATIPYERTNKRTGEITSTPYVQVNERVKAFRAICPGGTIKTTILSVGNGVVTMQAEVLDEEGRLIATGLAQEKESSSYINKTSYIENAETSAVGRALGFAGIGIDGSMASAEEVANAMLNQGKTSKGQKQEPASQKHEPTKEPEPEPDRTGEPAYPPIQDMVAFLEAKAQTNPKLAEFMEKACETIGAKNVKDLAKVNPSAITAWYNKLSKGK